MRTLLGFVDNVDVVGEAEDGQQAVRLVGELQPDVVLLDVDMPLLDGPAAAEAIRALHPATKIMLHTAQPDEDVRSRAARLGLPLLDKMRFDDVLTVLDPEPRPRLSLLPDPRIEAAVVAALTAAGGATPTLVVSPDGTVPFYNLAAADLLGLPSPPRRSHIDILRRYFETLRSDGAPDPDQRTTAVPGDLAPASRSVRWCSSLAATPARPSDPPSRCSSPATAPSRGPRSTSSPSEAPALIPGLAHCRRRRCTADAHATG